MANTHNWLFHKSDYTGKYHATKRENVHLLFNDITNPKVLGSSSIQALEEMINKTDGDLKLMEELYKVGKKKVKETTSY